MKELLRSTDLVLLSWAEALLAGQGIETVILDRHTSQLQGGALAVPCRLMVAEDDWPRAKRTLDATAEGEAEGEDASGQGEGEGEK